MDQPLILSLALDDESLAFFNNKRRDYFPSAINYLDAHLTLFHHLPPREPEIIQDIENIRQKRIQLNVVEVVSLGRGVAYKIESPELMTLHNLLQTKWMQWLTPQDKQKLWPHVTVQNKVTGEAATQTLQKLKTSFHPFVAYGFGLNLYTYQGGPWEFRRFYPFTIF